MFRASPLWQFSPSPSRLLPHWAILWSFATLSSASSNAATPSGRETNRELTQTLVEHYVSEGDTETALQILQEHLAFEPRDASSWNLLGLTRFRSGNLNEAITDCP